MKTLFAFLFFAVTAFGQTTISYTGYYVMDGGNPAAFAPVDATTYYMGYGEGVSVGLHATETNAQMTVPFPGTVEKVIWSVIVSTNGSNESVTHTLRLNAADAVVLSAAETYDPGASTAKIFTYSGLSVAVAAGDKIDLKIICPTWATNPTLASAHLLVLIRR